MFEGNRGKGLNLILIHLNEEGFGQKLGHLVKLSVSFVVMHLLVVKRNSPYLGIRIDAEGLNSH